jgi:NADH-quinone oxidoreductase subunit M
MSAELLLITAVWALPLLGALLARVYPSASGRAPRRIAIGAAVASLLMAVGVFANDAGQHAYGRTDVPAAPILLGLRYHVGVDGLSALLLPITAVVGLCALVAAPRRDLDRRLASQILVSLGSILGVLVSLDALILAAFWTLSLVPVRMELLRRRERIAGAAFDLVFFGSSAPMLLFVGALAVLGRGEPALSGAPFDLGLLSQSAALTTGWRGNLLGGLVLTGALARVGCFPLHLWIPPLAERGPGPLGMAAFATPLGIFLVARVLLPIFPALCEGVMPVLLPLGLVTALYGAVVALGQHDLRRMLGYFWISQQGFLLSGLSAMSPEGVSGALLHAIGTVVVRTGLLVIAGAVAARVGTTDVRLLGGLVRRAPVMSTGFLVLAAAAIGLPGSIGFVSEDLIAQGLLRTHAIAAGAVLVATALNGILLIRAFQRIFLGPPSPHADPEKGFVDLLPRERGVVFALIGLLLAGGMAASPLLAVRGSVVDALHAPAAATLPQHP